MKVVGRRYMSDGSPLPLRLREARLRAGLSQKALGVRAGIDADSASPRVNQYEKGRHTPDYPTTERLAEALAVPVPYLYAKDDDVAALLLAYCKLSKQGRSELFALAESVPGA